MELLLQASICKQYMVARWLGAGRVRLAGRQWQWAGCNGAGSSLEASAQFLAGCPAGMPPNHAAFSIPCEWQDARRNLASMVATAPPPMPPPFQETKATAEEARPNKERAHLGEDGLHCRPIHCILGIQNALKQAGAVLQKRLHLRRHTKHKAGRSPKCGEQAEAALQKGGHNAAWCWR